MSFNLTVTDIETTKVFNVVSAYTYPNHISLHELADICFHSVGDIAQRKVRLCIKALRKRGYLIIAKRGYSMAGDDPEPVIHFINGMYSRAHSLTTDADIMYRGLKQKYGDAVSEKVQQLPGQPMLDISTDKNPLIMNILPSMRNVEPPFRKSIDARGNEIALQFEGDA